MQFSRCWGRFNKQTFLAQGLVFLAAIKLAAAPRGYIWLSWRALSFLNVSLVVSLIVLSLSRARNKSPLVSRDVVPKKPLPTTKDDSRRCPIGVNVGCRCSGLATGVVSLGTTTEYQEIWNGRNSA